jgi:hypothetical protein
MTRKTIFECDFCTTPTTDEQIDGWVRLLSSPGANLMIGKKKAIVNFEDKNFCSVRCMCGYINKQTGGSE